MRSLAEDAGASDPDTLARTLTLLLDGGLASGSMDGRPDAPVASKAAAQALVGASALRSRLSESNRRPNRAE